MKKGTIFIKLLTHPDSFSPLTGLLHGPVQLPLERVDLLLGLFQLLLRLRLVHEELGHPEPPLLLGGLQIGLGRALALVEDLVVSWRQRIRQKILKSGSND